MTLILDETISAKWDVDRRGRVKGINNLFCESSKLDFEYAAHRSIIRCFVRSVPSMGYMPFVRKEYFRYASSTYLGLALSKFLTTPWRQTQRLIRSVSQFWAIDTLDLGDDDTGQGTTKS